MRQSNPKNAHYGFGIISDYGHKVWGVFLGGEEGNDGIWMAVSYTSAYKNLVQEEMSSLEDIPANAILFSLKFQGTSMIKFNVVADSNYELDLRKSGEFNCLDCWSNADVENYDSWDARHSYPRGHTGGTVVGSSYFYVSYKHECILNCKDEFWNNKSTNYNTPITTHDERCTHFSCKRSTVDELYWWKISEDLDYYKNAEVTMVSPQNNGSMYMQFAHGNNP